jgi:hypothetical protein
MSLSIIVNDVVLELALLEAASLDQMPDFLVAIKVTVGVRGQGELD